MSFEQALEKQLTARQRGTVTPIYSRKQIEQAFLETFELVGGVQRLAVWANEPENYETFLQLLMKLAPKDLAKGVEGQILEYRSNVPQSPLNRLPSQEEIEDADEQ